MMTETSVVARVDTMVSSEVDGEVVIMSIESGHFFRLNHSASRIWDLLDTPKDLATLCRHLGDRFEMDAVDGQADVVEFVSAMQAKGLLTVN